MTELLDDYTKATFPLELPWNGSGKVRLLAAFDGKVVGVSYGTYERDGETIEYLNQVLDWNGQGQFADNQYPEMNLPPPPAHTASVIAEYEDEIANLRERLDANPTAPKEWRSYDEANIQSLERAIAKLTGAA